MAVLSHELHWSGATGYAESKTVQFTAVYRVRTNDPLDQAAVILSYFQTTLGLPWLGSLYAYANDAYLATCSRIEPRRPSGSSTTWEVTVTYKTPDFKEDKPDANGNTSPNPLDWRPEIRISHSQEGRPAWKSTYRSGYKGAQAAKIPPNTTVVPSNSANVVFDPPMEKSQSLTIISIKKYQSAIKGSEHRFAHNAVNDSQFKIDYLAYTRDVSKYEAKVTGIEAAVARQTIDQNNTRVNIDYWEETYEMTIDPDTWRDKVPDRGIHPRAEVGDPDGRGGYVQPGDIPAGMPNLRRAVDADGMPITEPVLFDGDGQPLAAGLPPVFIEFSNYLEIDFRILDFYKGVIK